MITVDVLPSSLVTVSMTVPSAAVVITSFPSLLTATVLPSGSVAVVLPSSLVVAGALAVATVVLIVLPRRRLHREPSDGHTSP